eukprot:CAMPEP_0179866160 /NCGR_PEP_ID=MMETSP0982-20121206/17341_1 /TAXON_ID=483367 /ORGANISM="non described non described, Strain CCMP 2436" /LENGTH=53 /DNA_ID=CAMNT_0021755139 /DNA_START=201 /DNA_END=359 /DNA_ORIENTATION=-
MSARGRPFAHTREGAADAGNFLDSCGQAHATAEEAEAADTELGKALSLSLVRD